MLTIDINPDMAQLLPAAELLVRRSDLAAEFCLKHGVSSIALVGVCEVITVIPCEIVLESSEEIRVLYHLTEEIDPSHGVLVEMRPYFSH